MKRILCIVGSMNMGGAETFLMKIYRKLDKSKYQLDFCVCTSDECYYDKEIEQLGGKIHRIVSKTKRPLKSFQQIYKIVNKYNYDSVLRISANSVGAIDLLAAKWAGAKKIILRSSNANYDGKISILLHWLFQPFCNRVANVKIAPSTEAAVFTFGQRKVEKGEVVLLNNAVDTNIFKFSDDVRLKKRSELGLNDKFVVGHIGRFSYQKNHSYLIDVFIDVKQKRKNAVLILVGTGEIYEEIQAKVKKSGLEDDVIFLENRCDVNELLMAMDVLLLPSYYEGMPNVVVEAQATGLRCIVSDTVTKEANIIGRVKFLPILSDTIEQWSSETIKEEEFQRVLATDLICEAGYDLDEMVFKFLRLVFG